MSGTLSLSKDAKEALSPLLALKGTNDNSKKKSKSAVSRYLAKISELTGEETELDIWDMSLNAATQETDKMVASLTQDLQEKRKYKSVMEQALRSAKASEDVLQNQLDAERKAKELILREIEECRETIEKEGVCYRDWRKKEVVQAKEMNRLELRIKDLQMTLAQTEAQDQRAEKSLSAAGRKGRAIEHELIRLRVDNTALHEKNDEKEQRLMELSDNMDTEKDVLTREANAAKVKVIALKKLFEETQADIARLKPEIKEAQDSLERMRDTMRYEEELAAKSKKELEERMQEEEEANKRLCQELGKKTKIEIQLMTDLKTATAARKMLSKKLDEKIGDSLELSTSLKEIQRQTQVLEERLGEKNIKADSLAKNFHMIQSDAKVLQLQLTKEKHNMLEAEGSLKRQQELRQVLSRDITSRVGQDMIMTLRVASMEADANLLKKEVENKMKEEERSKELLMTTRGKGDIFQQRLEDAQQSFSELKTKMNAKKKECEHVEKHLKEKVKQLMYEEHESKIVLNELENTLRCKIDTIQHIKDATVLADCKIKDLTQMLESAAEAQEQHRQSMGRRVTEITNKNRLIEDEINQERRRTALLDIDLRNVDERLRTSLAQLGAQSKEAKGLAKVNGADQAMIMARLQEQTTKVEALNTQRAQFLADIKAWELKLEDEIQEKERAEKHLVEERGRTAKQSEELESKLDLELEQKSRIKMLEHHNQELFDKLEAKTSEEATLKIQLDELESQVDVFSQELREQEFKNQELLDIQNGHHNRISTLDEELEKQEQQHLADARAVKLSIISLQETLMEKVATVETLVKTTRTVKAKVKALGDQLEETEQAAVKTRAELEKDLQAEQREAAVLRGQLDQAREKRKLLRESITKKQTHMAQLDSSLVDSTNRGEILKSDADTKRKESEMMADVLEKKASRERELDGQINSREEEISTMRLEHRTRTTKAEELKKKLKQAEFQNKLLRNQVNEKMKAERYLLAELEAQRLHVQVNTHPESMKAVKAQIKANKELAGVLKTATN